MQLFKGDDFVQGRVFALPNNGRLVRILFDMSVETVDRDIQLAVLKPFYAKIIQIIVNVADFGRFFYRRLPE